MPLEHIVTEEIVSAYCVCPRKAYLLLQGEHGTTPHEYITLVDTRAAISLHTFLEARRSAGNEIRGYEEGIADPADIMTDVVVRTTDCEARIDALLRTRGRQQNHVDIIEPLLVAGTREVSRSDKLRLAFVSQVLAAKFRSHPQVGMILNVVGKVTRLRLSQPNVELQRTLRTIRSWITDPPSPPPPTILNDHCRICPFRNVCLDQAEKKDDLSLLHRMTPKVIQKYHKKGIFTIQQLSYLFRPRRQRKRRADAPSPLFRFELQALALRTGKTYVHELPNISGYPTELILDIEGIPDHDSHYLVGLIVTTEERTERYSWWADSEAEEAIIFQELLTTIAKYPSAPIYHYGSYEPKALKKTCAKYGLVCTDLLPRLVNVNSLIFGRVYFPVRSNSLKDLGECVGASWSTPDPSGVRSIAWRLQWEISNSSVLKDQLLTYNMEDCEALRLVVSYLKNLKYIAATRPDVQFTDERMASSTPAGQHIHNALQGILRSAHAEYQNNRIKIRSDDSAPPAKKKRGALKGHPGYHRIRPTKVNRTVRVRRALTCPQHPSVHLERADSLTEQVLIDLTFNKNGCRKTVTKYIGWLSRCPNCARMYAPPAIKRHGTRLFGHGFRAWVVYQRIVLRLPYRVIAQVIYDLFSEYVSAGSVVGFIRDLAGYYSRTEQIMLKRILASPFAHVDETKISIEGTDHYVWVVTDGTHVIFRLTQKREATLIQQLFNGYSGVLISDFYAGYDACNCRQQKCLVHLIRDMNDDLWKHPYNAVFEDFVGAFRDLLLPLMADVERYGLKRRHLNKHSRRAERFYRDKICGNESTDELTQTYQKRFLRYRENLFRFLEEDGIPWNNNTAERASRHLAVQRKISGSFFEHGAIPYLTLLGISQSCRFQGKSFLRFLLSEERDVDLFRDPKLRRPSRLAVPRGAG